MNDVKTEELTNLQKEVDAADELFDKFTEPMVRDRYYAKKFFEIVEILRETGILK